jgi:hypothetical protein
MTALIGADTSDVDRQVLARSSSASIGGFKNPSHIIVKQNAVAKREPNSETGT